MAELPPFDPQWLAAEEMMGGRQTLQPEPVDQSRTRFDTIFASLKPLLPPPSDAVTTTDTTVPSSGQKIRIYKPTAALSDTLPVGLYIHSGGWYSGSIENEDFVARNVCENSNIVLYSPDYRLAPENPYPAGRDDVFAAWEYLNATAAEHGGDATKKFVMGGSAGGNLAAVVTLKYSQDPTLRANGACIFCPAACHPHVVAQKFPDRYLPERYSDSPMIGNEILRQAWEWYAAPPEDPLASFVLHPDIRLLPSVYIAAPTKDPTHQETLLFGQMCKDKGVDAELIEWVGFPHFFWVLPMLPKSVEFMQTWNEKLKVMIAKA